MSETVSVSADQWSEALAFDAPYLIEKMVKDHMVDLPDEARALFREVKRYMVLVASDPTVVWSMYSLRIDHTWHQFILFTQQYIEYCRMNFDKYMQHAPSTAPKTESLTRRTQSTFDMFADRYEELFAEPLPDLWYDERNVTLDRRIVNSRLGLLSLRDDGDMVELVNGKGDAVFAIDSIARPALEFITATGTFFVREIPGDLEDDQRIVIVSTLVENRLLDLAA